MQVLEIREMRSMQEGINSVLTPKMRLKKTKGKIMQVDGGQIVRSLGRKDRHSKVYTAKGPRDRRVRLSADTAIQFYDVQDRLGYDRPSKAIDWLMKEAKAAIDALNEDQQLELPAAAASLYDPCAAFHRTTCEQVLNGQDSIHSQASNPFNINQGLHTCLQESPVYLQENPFSSSGSGDAKEQYYPFAQNHELFADDRRESLQSSFAPPIHAAINGFGNDDWFLAFPFLQGIHGNEEESYQ